MVGKEKVALNRSWILEKVYWPLRAGRGSTTVSKRAHGTRSRVPAAPKLCREEKGAEMVEFALIFAGLMMLMLGIVSFARAYNVYQTITRAAREGARVAVLPTSVHDGNTYIDKNGTFTSPDSPIFDTYIKPALQAANLNPNACASSSSTDCISNYNEQVAWLNPTDTDKQCGLTISFVYPYRLSIPFTTMGLTTLHLHTDVKMRLENANYQQNGAGGTYTPTCP